MLFYRIVIISLCLLPFSLPVASHETKPTIADITFKKDTSVELQITTNLEALITIIQSKHAVSDTHHNPHYKKLKTLSAPELQQEFTPLEATYRQDLKLLLSDQALEWQLIDIHIPETKNRHTPRKSTMTYSAKLPLEISTVSWQYNKAYGNSVVHFRQEGTDEKTTYWVKHGEASPAYTKRPM